MTRIESASSINTYRNCARKYFYHYKLGLPTKDSIAALNGGVVHTALENFFKIDPANLHFNTYENELRNHLMNSFNQAWIEVVPQLSALTESKDTIKDYYQDSLFMLDHFVSIFLKKLQEEMNKKSLTEAFNTIKPETEICITSATHQIRGYIDAIHKNDGEILILDYKTSRSDEVTEDYKLQLAIYVLLFEEQQGKMPDKVGLYFLRHGQQKLIPVTPELIAFAKKECKNVHNNTISQDIEDYPKNLGPLCKWCDYKDYCFGQKSLSDYTLLKEQAHNG